MYTFLLKATAKRTPQILFKDLIAKGKASCDNLEFIQATKQIFEVHFPLQPVTLGTEQNFKGFTVYTLSFERFIIQAGEPTLNLVD